MLNRCGKAPCSKHDPRWDAADYRIRQDNNIVVLVCAAWLRVKIIKGKIEEMKKVLLVTGALCLSGCPISSTTSAEVTNSRLVPSTAAQGQPTQTVLINWRNTGTTPIRTITADIDVYDSSGAKLPSGAKNHHIYESSNSQAGIAAGETYVEPDGEGFVLVTAPGFTNRAVKVEVRITGAYETTPMY